MLSSDYLLSWTRVVRLDGAVNEGVSQLWDLRIRRRWHKVLFGVAVIIYKSADPRNTGRAIVGAK